MFLIDIAADCRVKMIKLTFKIKLHDFNKNILKNVYTVTELFLKNQKILSKNITVHGKFDFM